MGNALGSSRLESETLTKSYDLTRGKEGYAVLVGSDWCMNETNPCESSVARSLSSMDKALGKTCNLETLAPYLSVTPDESRTILNKEDFDRLCTLLFDSVNSLARYSSYFHYYCGFGNETGMLTTDRQCIPYSAIFEGVLQRVKSSGKPTVFVYDCHYYDDHVVNIKSVVKAFTDQITGLELADMLVCFTFSSVGPDTCPPGVFTSELAHAIQQYSHLMSLTELIDLAGSRAKFKTNGNLQGPLCLDYLKSQFMLIEDPSVKISLEPEDWISYCCTQVDENFSSSEVPSSSSGSSTPGLGHYVFVIFSDDACGPHQPLSRVYSLANSLSSLGFQVFCDCVGQTSSPVRGDWVRWYSICSSLCDNILLVSSPLMAAQLLDQSSVCPSSAACARVLTGIRQKMSGSPEPSLRMFPVLLSSDYDQSCVPPSLFAGEKIHHIVEDQISESFDYHSLVFGMSRLPTPTPPVGHVVKLHVPINRNSADIQCPSLTTLQEVIDYFYKPVKQGYKVVTQVKPVPQQHSLFAHYPTAMPMELPNLYHHQAPPQPFNPYSQPPPPPIQHNPSTVVSSDLLHKPVSIQAMLWLSGKIVQWKFLGRHLGMEESELQRVELDNPQNISEQSFQTLNKWKDNQMSEEVNYGVLFKAVEFAEGRRLKEEFVDFVRNSNSNYT